MYTGAKRNAGSWIAIWLCVGCSSTGSAVDAGALDGQRPDGIADTLPTIDVGHDVHVRFDGQVDPDATSGLDAIFDSRSDAGGVDGVVAPAKWPFVPASYDCTSLVNGRPPRTSDIPLSCAFDPTCTTQLVAAHRGAGADSQEVVSGFFLPLGRFAPEDTLAAIRAAIVVGADFVELDVQQTKDGHLVLIHDADVRRTTTGTGTVSELTLAEIQALTIKTGQFPGDFSCVKVPTLASALALAKGRININADLKTSAVDKVALEVEAAGMLDQVLFSSKDLAKLATVRATVPSARVQARADTSVELADALSLVPPPAVVEVDEAILTPGTIASVHGAGGKVFVNAFTYDIQGYLTGDPNSYNGIVAKQPDVIQTDRADLVLKSSRASPKQARLLEKPGSAALLREDRSVHASRAIVRHERHDRGALPRVRPGCDRCRCRGALRGLRPGPVFEGPLRAAARARQQCGHDLPRARQPATCARRGQRALLSQTRRLEDRRSVSAGDPRLTPAGPPANSSLPRRFFAGRGQAPPALPRSAILRWR